MATEELAVDPGDEVSVTKREADLLLQELLDEIEENVNKSQLEDLQTDYAEPVPLPSRYYYQPPQPQQMPSDPMPLPPLPTPHQPKVEMVANEEDVAGDDETTAVPEESVVNEEPISVVVPPPPVSEPEPLQLLPPADGVEAMGIVVPMPSLPVNFSLIQGSDQCLYLLPTLPSVPGSAVKPRHTRLLVNVNDDMATIVAQINDQRLTNYQFMVRETVELNGWTAKSLRIFHRQLMGYVQLLGQMFIQTFSHQTLWTDAQHHKRLLDDLVAQAETSNTLRELCWNLADMQAICTEWEADLNVESVENKQYVSELVTGALNPRLVQRFVSHKAFLFPEHLPQKAAVQKDALVVAPPSRATLFVLCMHEHNCREVKGKRLADTIRAFRKKYGEKRVTGSYYNLVMRNEMIQEYLRTGKVPEIHHAPDELPVDGYDEAVPLNERPIELLPLLWRRVVEKERKTKAKTAAIRESVGQRIPGVDPPAPMILANPTQVTMNYPNFQAQFKMPIYYGVGGPAPPGGEFEDEEDDDDDDEGVGGMDRGPLSPRARAERKRKYGALMNKIRQALMKQKQSNKPKKRAAALKKIRERRRLTSKLHRLISRFDRDYDENMDTLDPNLISTKLFNYFKEVDIFIRILHSRTVRTGNVPTMLNNIIDVDEKGVEMWRSKNDEHRLPTKPNLESRLDKDHLFAWKYVKIVELELRDVNFPHFLTVLKGLRLKTDSVADFYLVSKWHTLIRINKLTGILFLFPSASRNSSPETFLSYCTCSWCTSCLAMGHRWASSWKSASSRIRWYFKRTYGST